MTEENSGRIQRRSFLKGAGTAGALALAGCTQSTDGGSGSTDGSDGSSDGGDGSDGSDGGSTGGGDQLSGEVIVKGSSTVFPISDSFAEAFMGTEEYSRVNVTVDSTGSGGGFTNHFCPGESDINGASRPIQENEMEQCSSNDVEPVEFQIAGDALTMAVNNDADWVDCITPDEMSQIWREDGAQMWSDIRDDWPDQEFNLFGPASTSGTYDWFNNNIIGEDLNHTTDHQPTEEDETIVQGIRDNPNGMGYFGYAYYNSNSDLVKALEVDGGQGCTPPNLENAKDGSYPMARPLYMYVSEAALQREEVYEFVRFYLERAETDNVSDIGYVPSSADLREENLDRLEEIAG
jgi:phosphate transport system substrate-binding protein